MTQVKRKIHDCTNTHRHTKAACISDDWPAAPYWPIRQMDSMPKEM